MIRKFALLSAAALTLSACGDSQQVVEDDMSTAAETGDVALLPVLESINQDGVDIEFDPTLGICTFDSNGEVLLVAGSTGEEGSDGIGVVKMNGQDMVLEGSELGGPDALGPGPMMFSGDYTVEIDRSEIGSEAEMESTSYDATLTLRKDGMSEVVYGPGTWECSV